MRTEDARYISNEEIKRMSPELQDQLNLVTRFWYDLVQKNDSGFMKKPTPRQIYHFILKHNKSNDLSKKVSGQKLSKKR